MLSILARLDDGSTLCQSYSRGHAAYDEKATSLKIEQAMTASGPRTCENINQLWGNCSGCEFYKKCKSPILIKGDNHIASEPNGFWLVHVKKDGTPAIAGPDYPGLLKKYCGIYTHLSIAETGLVYKYTGTHWILQEPLVVHAWLENIMSPGPKHAHCVEFERLLRRSKLKGDDFMRSTRKINFANGVYDTVDREFSSHSPLLGFPYVLPFNYDEGAGCPKWEDFLREVTLNRDELAQVLQEYIGYCLSGIDPGLVEKCMILHGSGSNGKSVFLRVLQGLFGKENYSSLDIEEALSDPEVRGKLLHKFVNITEEVPRKGLVNGSKFKNLVSGGEMNIRKLYHGTFMVKNNTKFIMACNEIPYLSDITQGTRRRLLIVPFDYIVNKTNINPLLGKELLEELPGIFNWALEGYRRLLANNYQFSESAVIEKKVEDSFDEVDSVSQFLEDCCEFTDNDDDVVQCKVMYAAYYEECKSSGQRPYSQSIFARRLGSYYLRKFGSEHKGPMRRRIAGKARRIWTGVILDEECLVGGFSV